MSILKKIERDKNFTQIDNAILQREDLTYEAKGLLAELLSRPQDWKIHKTQLIRPHTKISKITRIFKELQRNGYLYVHSETDPETKQFVDRYWIASEIPLEKKKFKEYVKSLTIENLSLGSEAQQQKTLTWEKPSVGKSATTNKDIIQIKSDTNIEGGEKENEFVTYRKMWLNIFPSYQITNWKEFNGQAKIILKIFNNKYNGSAMTNLKNAMRTFQNTNDYLEKGSGHHHGTFVKYINKYIPQVITTEMAN